MIFWFLSGATADQVLDILRENHEIEIDDYVRSTLRQVLIIYTLVDPCLESNFMEMNCWCEISQSACVFRDSLKKHLPLTARQLSWTDHCRFLYRWFSWCVVSPLVFHLHVFGSIRTISIHHNRFQIIRLMNKPCIQVRQLVRCVWNNNFIFWFLVNFSVFQYKSFHRFTKYK